MSRAVLAQSPVARLLASPTFLLCLAGVLLPNILWLGAYAAGMGAAPRTGFILAYATLLLVARLVPPAVTIVLYLAVVAFDLFTTVATMFNLGPAELASSLHLGGELNLFTSPVYGPLILAVTLAVLCNVVILARTRGLLRRGNPLILMGIAILAAVTEDLASSSPHYRFGRLYGIGKPVESAARSSGFHTAALGGSGRNVLMVVVEALGQFADPAHERLLLARFGEPALGARYDVTNGSVAYYGSTTAAEMRELCDTRESYQTLLDGADFECLPEQMAARGYSTVALHNFTNAFFERRNWYPKIGFETRIFQQDLAAGDTYRQCGLVMQGPCDTEMFPVIAERLKTAKTPTFFYWLTLSTHVPIEHGEGTPRLDCARDGGRIGHTEVCHMTEMWMDLFDGIARLATEHPDMEILVVGDHAPPIWSRAGRHMFSPGRVPWFRLTPRAPQDGARVADLPLP